MQDFELTDGEIILRPINMEHATAQLAGDDEENVRWLSGGVSTMETVCNWILRMRAAWGNDGPVYTFVIFDVSSAQQVGMVDGNSNLAQIGDLEPGEVNISYNIYPDARGKGYATRAVNLIQPFLKGKGLHTALIRVNPENKKSLGVAARADFVKVGENNPKPGQEKLIIFKKKLV